MNPYALPRASSRRVRRPSLAVRSHFHQPRVRVSHWSRQRPERAGFGLCALAVLVGFLSVMLVACGVMS